MQNMVHKLPVLGEHEATDPAKIVKWAKDTLNLGRAVPKLLEGYNLLHFSLSKEIRVMWAALTADVDGSPEDDYPEDMNLDSEDEADLIKKREWHVEWLETVIAYYGTNQQDSVFDVVRRIVKWNWDAALATELKINQWALSCAKAQSAVSEEAWSAADSKALFTACAKVLPEEVKSLLNQNKPAGGNHEEVVLKKGRGEAAALALPKRWARDQCNPLPNARNPSLACEGARSHCRAGPRSVYTGAAHGVHDRLLHTAIAAADGLYSASYFGAIWSTSRTKLYFPHAINPLAVGASYSVQRAQTTMVLWTNNATDGLVSSCTTLPDASGPDATDRL